MSSSRRVLLAAVFVACVPGCARSQTAARPGQPAAVPLPAGPPDARVLEVPVLAYIPPARGTAGIEVRLRTPDGRIQIIGRIEIFPVAPFAEADPPRAFRFRIPQGLAAAPGVLVELAIDGLETDGASFRFGPLRRVRAD